MTDRVHPAAMVNITNKCTLRCRHSFIYRDHNPNDARAEMAPDAMIATLTGLQRRHSINTMVWMGGEPLLRPDVLKRGVEIFPKNHVTTNGTLDLLDLPNSLYVVSIDGPPEICDSIRGQGDLRAGHANAVPHAASRELPAHGHGPVRGALDRRPHRP